jgi:catalase
LTIFFNAWSEAASKRHLSSQHPLIHPNAGPILLEDYHLVEKLANVSFV